MKLEVSNNKTNVTKNILNKLCVFLATGFGVGYFPKAPGTVASLLGLGFGFLLHCVVSVLVLSCNMHSQIVDSVMFFLFSIVLIIISSLIAVFCITEVEKSWNIHDDRKIVIDEIIGQGLTICLFQPSFSIYLLGFVMFRFFDILKPGLIGWCDKNVETPFGTLLDDLIAGAVAMPFLGIFWYFLQKTPL